MNRKELQQMKSKKKKEDIIVSTLNQVKKKFLL